MHKTINYKHCPSCLIDVPIENFYKSTTGYSSKCKSCTIAYNTEYRRNNKTRTRPRRVSLGESNHRIIKNRGPGNAMFRGRYVHGYSEFALICGPWGYIADGELFYGEYNDDDVLHTLHSKHMKLSKTPSEDISLEGILERITLVKNSRGVPISVRFVRGLVSRCQYFLWMDKPRKLLISEVSDQLVLTQEILNFLIPEKSISNLNTSLPGILKNSDSNMPQVPNITYDVTDD